MLHSGSIENRRNFLQTDVLLQSQPKGFLFSTVLWKQSYSSAHKQNMQNKNQFLCEPQRDYELAVSEQESFQDGK